MRQAHLVLVDRELPGAVPQLAAVLAREDAREEFLVGALEVRVEAVEGAVDEQAPAVRAFGGHAQRAQVRERDALSQVRRIDARHVQLDLSQAVEALVAVDPVEREHELHLGRVVDLGLPPRRPPLEADEHVVQDLVAVLELVDVVVGVVVEVGGAVRLHRIEVVDQRRPFGRVDLQLVGRQLIVGEDVRARAGSECERTDGAFSGGVAGARIPPLPVAAVGPPSRPPTPLMALPPPPHRGRPRFSRERRALMVPHADDGGGDRAHHQTDLPTRHRRLPRPAPTSEQRVYQARGTQCAGRDDEMRS